jgi:hypothetical protein
MLNIFGFPYNVFYDLIRSSSAKLRHQMNYDNQLDGLISNSVIFTFGSILSIIGVPVSIFNALIGKGGTIEIWAKPQITNDESALNAKI